MKTITSVGVALLSTFGAVVAQEDFKITGLVAPVLTPFTLNSTLDLSQVPMQAKYLSSTNVNWAFTAGTTGESVDLTLAERLSLAETWIDVAPGFNMKVIVHVGADSVADAATMAAHAEAHGADAIAAMPPTYIKPSTLDMLVETMQAVAAAAPNTPFYYYHIPSMTGANFPMSEFVKLADQAIPTLRGIKFTDYQLNDYQLAREHVFEHGPTWRKGKVPNMLFGRDEYLLGALPYGCDGAVGSTYNFNGELQQIVFDAFNSGDMDKARAAQLGTVTLIKGVNDISSELAGAYGWKMIMDAAGMSVGPARLPYASPTKTATDALESMVKSWCGTLTNSLKPGWCSNV